MKILNLYAGIGGNRKLWGDDHDIVAVEINPNIAEIYQEFFPKDKMIIEDAHQYLLDHFDEFDFIWSSPPCPTHSQFAKLRALSNDQRTGNSSYKPQYPDMKLYEEILLLQHLFQGKYCVENVVGYYEPLITPQKIQRHYFWANFYIHEIVVVPSNIKDGKVDEFENKLGFSLEGRQIDKRLALRNCVDPNLGLHVFTEAFREYKTLL